MGNTISHTTTVKSIEIRSLTALEQAVSELAAERGFQYQWKENCKPRLYYGTDQFKQNCEKVLSIDGCSYEIGFHKQEDGTYAAITDFYEYGNTPVSKFLKARGANSLEACGCNREEHAIGGLLQEYAKQAAIEQATSQGYFVEDCTIDEESGEILMNIAGV